MTHASCKANKVMTHNEHSLETSHNVQKCHDHEEQARVKKMATVSVNVERYNDDEVGVSYIWWWKGSVVWCMSPGAPEY